jgi:REP element-mobilizing transposase RayT
MPRPYGTRLYVRHTIYNPSMTKFDPQKHPFDNAQGRHRRSIRLKGYDYSQEGAYFVTIVTWRREFLFGEIVNQEMRLSQRGKIVDECWRSIPEHFPHAELGAYVIMPNHVHGIIIINPTGENWIATNTSQSVGARHASPPQHASPLRPRGVASGSLGAIVGSFKSAVTKRIGRELNETGIWQRNYYEHIIRDDKDLQNKTDYIEANPLLWDEDDENPVNGRG